jgi:uncharacterized protein (DUF58 family)
MSQAETNASKYADPKTLDKIKRLDVRARCVVEGFITGQHRSPYNGFAIEFAAHREYAPGDDLRHIDWKVWSKTDRLYIKEYEEETNLKCHILLDSSKSMQYGSETGWSKYDYAATAAASLAYMMQQQQDSVGMVMFSNKIDKVLKSSTHPSHMKLLFHELESTQPSETTDIADPFMQLAGQIRSRGMVVLFSDLFLDPADLAKSLNQFRIRRHEVVVFHVMHHDEIEFPFQDNTLFKGMEVDAQLHTEPRALRDSYMEAVEEYMTKIKTTCAAAGIDHVLLDTSKPLDSVLTSYLNYRAKRRKRLT